jgi:hypothetical protein
MLATIALAALTLPAAGKYMYAFTTATGAQIAADIWIYATGQGIVTHEEMHSSTPIATTDQHFDDSLRLNWYLGANDPSARVFMHVTPWRAQVSVAGKTTNVPIDRLASQGCVLVLDNGLTSSVLLPSLVRATRASVCTFIAVSGATTVTATIDGTAPRTRPKDAKAGDVALTVEIGSVTERIWYDPQTLIPDYIDLGRNGAATLAATTGEQ